VRLSRAGRAPDIVVINSNFWDLSMYATHGASRGGDDLPLELLKLWLEDADQLFGELKVGCNTERES